MAQALLENLSKEIAEWKANLMILNMLYRIFLLALIFECNLQYFRFWDLIMYLLYLHKWQPSVAVFKM